MLTSSEAVDVPLGTRLLGLNPCAPMLKQLGLKRVESGGTVMTCKKTLR